MVIDIQNPPRKYAVISADVPWKFLTRSAKGRGRSADRHYDTMTLDDIKALPVGNLADKHCVLFFWVTDPMLRHGMDVMDAWGFPFKTVAFYWTKLKKSHAPGNLIDPLDERSFFFGQGYYTRANCEQCLVGVRGSPKRLSKGVRRLIVSPVREHSRKPDETLDRIERLYEGPYVELFSRSSRQNWDCFGNEAGKFG